MVRGRRRGPIGELLGALGLQRLFDLKVEESVQVWAFPILSCVKRNAISLGQRDKQTTFTKSHLRPFPIPSDFLITIASLPIRLKAHLKSAESIKAMTLSQQPHRGKAATKSPSNSSITHVCILSSPIQSPIADLPHQLTLLCSFSKGSNCFLLVHLRPSYQDLLQPYLDWYQLGAKHHVRHARGANCDGPGEIQRLLGAVGQADGYGFGEGLFQYLDIQ